MSIQHLRWYHRLGISNAYGQLIALIFIPIMVLAGVGASLVLVETAGSSRSEQRNSAFAVLARYQPTAERLNILLDRPQDHEKVRTILQNMLNESDLLRVAMIDSEGRARLSFGYGSNVPWPTFAANRETFGPLHSDIGTAYGQRAGFTSDGPIWLVVDMDNKPLQLARYRVWLVLAITGLLTLLLLLLCLNFYSRRWIAPIYEIRLQLQRLSADTLGQIMKISGTGELRLLQLDLITLLERLYESFEELKQHTEQTEDDLRKTLDALEIQNITYRQSRDQAISANQSKSVFLANISHELRTPLNSIDGFVNLMARKGALTDQQTIYIQTIQKSSAHLLALVNDVLDFSKIDAGKLTLEQAPFDLEQAVFDVIDMLSPLACEKKIDLAVYYYEDMPTKVNGDALRFKQILTNLVSNAIKFTPDGDIIVRARLDNSTEDHHLIHVSVQDSGIGLSGADRKRLFESFSQGDPSVTRQYGGTGLGLAISRQLVKLMRGKIGFEENQERHPTDKGATFWFTVQLGIVVNDMPQSSWPNLSDWNILSCIQHPASANVLRGYLTQLQVTQQEAQSIPDLFGRLIPFDFERHAHSWVIVDSGGDIEALLREIRTRYQGSLAVYGYQMAIDPDVLKRYHAVALYEPMSRGALLATIQNVPQNLIDVQPQYAGHGLHILAVDDHLPNLMVLEALLNDLGVEVTNANSGLEAIEIINARHDAQHKAFDLVFMDIQMPRMSGLEATQAIRLLENEWKNTKSLPIIALTAHVLSDEKANLIACGMNDYVSKPIQIEELIRILRQWTNHDGQTDTALNVYDAASDNASSSNFYPDDFSAEEFYQALPDELADELVDQPQSHILDWTESVRLSAGKADLALELLQMLLDSFKTEKLIFEQLIAQKDYPELEQRIHRLYGASRYVGIPTLQQISRALEKLLMHQRKSKIPITAGFEEEVTDYHQQLLEAMDELETEAVKVLNQP